MAIFFFNSTVITDFYVKVIPHFFYIHDKIKILFFAGNGRRTEVRLMMHSLATTPSKFSNILTIHTASKNICNKLKNESEPEGNPSHRRQPFGCQAVHKASQSFLHSCRSIASLEGCSTLRIRDYSQSASAVLLLVDFKRPLFLLRSKVYLRATTERMTDTCPTSPCKSVKTIPMSTYSASLKSSLLEIFLG